MQTNNKLREVLTKVKEWMERRIATRGFEASATFPTMLEDVVLPALATPPRNCDVGTVEEQDERFNNFCLSHYEPCNVDGECWRCPLFKTKISCPIAWAQMPYE